MERKHILKKLLPVLALVICHNISLPGQVSISAIQGPGDISPYLGQQIFIDTAIVTAVSSGTVFIQSLPSDRDNDPMTSEGLWLQTGQSSGLAIGDLIYCSGIVTEDGSGNTVLLTDELIELGQKLFPVSFAIDTLQRLENRARFSYEFLEGQLVSFEMGIVIEPTDRSNDIRINPLGSRSFREPGITFPTVIPGLPQFDNNPQNIRIIPGRFIDFDLNELSAGSQVVCNGVIVERPDGYAIWPIQLAVIPNVTIQEAPQDDEYTLSIATLNLRQFGTDNIAFNSRLDKIIRYLEEIAGYPDIIALQEIRDRNAILRLVEEIGELSDGSSYTYYFNAGNSTSSIQSAFIYKNCFTGIQFSRLGLFESLSTGGRLHDRPPLLMELDMPGDTLRKMKILNLHLRSLNGIEGNNANFVRLKRHEQALSVARMIKSFPEDEPLIVIGDYNAFEFTDGYVDVFAQISGKKSKGAIFEVESILDDSLDYPLEDLPADDRYTFIFNGHSQTLDHILTRNMSVFNGENYYMLRGNADFPPSWENDPEKKWRITDHDGILAHFGLSNAQVCRDPEPEITELDIILDNPGSSINSEIQLRLPEDTPSKLELFSLDGKLIEGHSLELGRGVHEISLSSSPPAGIYFVVLSQAGQRVVKKWILN